MIDLDIIKVLEKQIGEQLKPCALTEVMNTNARGCYSVDEQQQIIGLNLQNYKLTHFTFVKTFIYLRKLNLALNKIVELAPLKKLNQLNELNLQKNEITDIRVLEKLENLQNLNLQANKITNIKPLYHLKKLNVLNLSSNVIADFESLVGLNQLTHLNLSDNGISSLLVLKMMSHLIELDLRFNKISNLNELKSHKELTKLFLSSNNISDITPLTELVGLTQLYLNSNKIKDISAINNFHFLKLLDLRSNRIDDIRSIEKLTELTHLHLESNEISDISVLKNLSKLTQLNLRTNQVHCIQALKDLKYLSHLYLSDNQIKVLPRWILNLNLPIKWNNGGQGISVIANPIENPPIDIIRQGNTTIKNFFDSLQDHNLNKVKVLLVGDKDVGKTSLSQALRHLPFNDSQSQTLGININSWEQDDLCVNLWDFGGEQSLLATHKLFFSKHSLYILVLDNRKRRFEERWLKRIESFGQQSSIIIVLNKFDEENSYDIDRHYLLHRYKGLRGIFPVSSAQGVGLEVFKRGLIMAYKQIPSFNKSLSLSTFRIKEALEKQQQQHCVSYDSYLNICHKQGLKAQKQQQNLLELLHDLGNTIYFNELKSSYNYIFDPIWLTKGLYKIITSKLIINNNGILQLKYLSTILSSEDDEKSYSKKEQLYLIEVLKKFYLCYQINQDKILIPQLLNEEKPEIIFDLNEALSFQIYYNLLDESLVLHLIIKLYSQIDFNKSSRHCLFLDNHEFDCLVLLEVDYDKDLISLKVNGDRKRDCYAFIRKTLYSIPS